MDCPISIGPSPVLPCPPLTLLTDLQNAPCSCLCYCYRYSLCCCCTVCLENADLNYITAIAPVTAVPKPCPAPPLECSVARWFLCSSSCYRYCYCPLLSNNTTHIVLINGSFNAPATSCTASSYFLTAATPVLCCTCSASVARLSCS